MRLTEALNIDHDRALLLVIADKHEEEGDLPGATVWRLIHQHELEPDYEEDYLRWAWWVDWVGEFYVGLFTDHESKEEAFLELHAHLLTMLPALTKEKVCLR